jgi:predicted RNase H-like nuclease (RuvC/YqgF family)
MKSDTSNSPPRSDKEKEIGQQMAPMQQVDANQIAEKDQAILELKETIEIMELKIKKLEELIKLKDNKIQSLTNKLAQAGIH